MEITIGSIQSEVIVFIDTTANGTPTPTTDGEDNATDEVRSE